MSFVRAFLRADKVITEYIYLRPEWINDDEELSLQIANEKNYLKTKQNKNHERNTSNRPHRRRVSI